MMASLKHETNEQQQQQQQQQHSLMKEEEDDSRPFHLLMSEDVSRRRLDDKLQRDWLSKRHEIFAQIPSLQAETNDSSTQDPTKKLWSGATDVEKALISCCSCCSSTTSSTLLMPVAASADQQQQQQQQQEQYRHQRHHYVSHSVTPSEDEDDPEEDSLVTGALLKSKIVDFLGTAACQAQDLSSRALVLAILERTHQLDERIYHTYELACAELPAAADTEVKKASAAENNSNNHTRSTDDTVISPAASAGTIKPPPPRRLLKFLCAGGLRLLSRWLMEASEPVEQEVMMDASSPPQATTGGASTTSSTRQQPQRGSKTQYITKPSMTGPLLLPLLEFLALIPFDRQLITESKINKQIKNLSKEIDALVAQGPPSSKTKTAGPWTDAVAGGYPVEAVQQAVNHVKQVWEEQAKLSKLKKKSTPVVTNPFDKVTQLLKERVKELETYESARASASAAASSDQQQQQQAPQPPEWLVKALAKQPQKKRKLRQQQQQETKPRESAQQMARRERENERAAFMKTDLEKAQRERQELLRKLREMKHLKAVEDKKAEEASSSKRRVRWKDGMGPQSKMRKRDVLEQVFIFIKDQDRLAAMEKNVDGAAEAGEDEFFADEDMFNTEDDN